MSEASPFQTTPPTTEASRIESLDVLRGFALLGILLLNIIGFGMLSPSYSNPGFDLIGSSALNIGGWLTVELFAEGAMRCLFSILFGAGVVLFTDTKAGWVHYKRTFWLLMFGFVNAYILVWSGDILVVYAVAGALLYLARNRSAKSLFTLAGILILLMSLLHAMMAFGLGEAEKAHQRVVAAEASGDEISKVDQEAAQSWLDFISDFELNDSDVKAEIAARTDSYLSVFSWTAGENAEVYAFVLPVFLLWDALAMMMLGMALYKTGVLQATRSRAFYTKLMVVGIALGLLINGYEINRAISSNFDVFATFAQMQPTYHLGRMAMALGYIGLLCLICQSNRLHAFTSRLAVVGRMALTNYLMQSLICAVIFTGLGFGLLGDWQRVELYGVVIAIWVFQTWFSAFWLERYRFGPLEWVWRALTYGSAPSIKR